MIKLLNKNNQEINFDYEKIKTKISELQKMLIFKKDISFLSKNINNSENILEFKEMIENIRILINDLGYPLNFKEVQNIIKKKNPQSDTEHFVCNLWEALSLFWQNKKIIHQNNVFMLYQILNDDNKFQLGNDFYRKNNNISYLNKGDFKLDILDFNLIPSAFNQLIEYINSNDEILPIIKLHIFQLHMIAISPFTQKNFLISKILSICYLLFYIDKENLAIMPIQDFLNAHYLLDNNDYLFNLKRSLKENDYTFFIEFILEGIIQIKKNNNLMNKISSFLKEKRKIYLSEYEKKILFMILFHNMNEFDWKIFYSKTKWNVSKQYIIRNLNKLENYSILKSKSLKNRKFFFFSRFTRNLIQNLKL